LVESEILQVLTAAIKDAHLYDPDAGFGSTWDRPRLSGEEATHYARAVLNALRNAGLDVTIQVTQGLAE
jgi:hypothetical protein